MSVLSYLETRASQAVLSSDEKSSISTSISTLSSRLNSYFTVVDDGLSRKFQFGSSTRGTILPRKIDAKSDIDYMIVFEKGGLKPQSYLDRLRKFVEKQYSTSEIYQSSPTIVLELNHIKFDLVPALTAYGTTYNIPDGPNDWRSTNPNDFNATLDQKNKDNSFLIKPTIRLAKLWNASNGYVFDSYSFEKWITEQWFLFCSNQKEYLFSIFDKLQGNSGTKWRDDKIAKAKEIVASVRKLETEGYPNLAESEVKKLIPEA